MGLSLTRCLPIVCRGGASDDEEKKQPKYQSTRLYRLSKRIPKIELHIHLDGSLSPEFIFKRCREMKIKAPPCAPERLRQWVQDAKKKPEKFLYGKSKKERKAYGALGVFSWANEFLQTAPALRDATADLCRRLIKDNVLYAEIRFCPALHTKGHLTEREALEAVVDGFSVTRERLPGGIIVCGLRTLPPSHSMAMAKLADDTPGAVGFDMAGVEEGHPLRAHRRTIEFVVRRSSIGCTVHAGEWAKNTVENVELAVQLGVDRIGHALQMSKQKDLMRKVKEKGICVEVNPVSNVHFLKNGDLTDHPMKEFIRNGICCSLGCDNTLISGSKVVGPSLPTEQVYYALSNMGITLQELRACTIETAMSHLFDRSVDGEWLARRVAKKFDSAMAADRRQYEGDLHTSYGTAISYGSNSGASASAASCGAGTGGAGRPAGKIASHGSFGSLRTA